MRRSRDKQVNKAKGPSLFSRLFAAPEVNRRPSQSLSKDKNKKLNGDNKIHSLLSCWCMGNNINSSSNSKDDEDEEHGDEHTESLRNSSMSNNHISSYSNKNNNNSSASDMKNESENEHQQQQEGDDDNQLIGRSSRESFTVISNFDSANMPLSNASNDGSLHDQDSSSHQHDFDDENHRILKRPASISSIKSTPMQLLLTKVNTMLPRKSLTGSTFALVKHLGDHDAFSPELEEMVSQSSHISSSSPPNPGQDECDAIIEAVSSVWTQSLQPTPMSEISTKTEVFCGKKKASVDLKSYMQRLVRITNRIYSFSSSDREGAGIRSLIISMIYIERILSLNDDLELVELNIHRLFLAAFMLALKMFEDEIPSEQALADIAGVKEDQLHAIESRFCRYIDFQLFINPDEYYSLFSKIVLLCNLNFQPERPEWIGLDQIYEY